MSNPKWLIFLFSVWITSAFLGTIIEGAWFTSGEEESAMSTLLALPVFTQGGDVSIVGTLFSTDAWGALFKILTLDFAFFTGSTEIIRWIIFMPIAMGIVIVFGFFMLSHIPFIGRGGA